METLAVLLISLAVVHAAPEPHLPGVKAPYTSGALNLIGTDIINDVLKFYNAYFSYWDAADIPDITVDHKEGTSFYHVRASEGVVLSGTTTLASEPANLAFTEEILQSPSRRFYRHRLHMNFSISIDHMQIIYDNVTVVINVGNKVTDDRTNNVEAHAFIENSRFHLQAEQSHILLDDGRVESCQTTVKAITTEEFGIGKVSITGPDSSIDSLLEVLAEKFKNRLLDGSYAARVVEAIIDDRAPEFFRYCRYVSGRLLEASAQ